MANLRTFSVGQTLTKAAFDTTKSVEEVVAILSSLQYEGDPTLDEDTINLLDVVGTKQDNGVLYAVNYNLENEVYLITCVYANRGEPTIVFSSVADPDNGILEGFQNLDEDGSIDVDWEVDKLYQSALWNNGLIVGSSYIDTVVSGTYDVETGEWGQTDLYSITMQNGKYLASGIIPYGSANSLFPTPGYRFAVRISRPTITASSQLANGNICLITNTEKSGQFFQYTKVNFETDGSLIVVFAPTQETLATERQVKIAWGVGETLSSEDYTVYTFDLSNVSLAPIPEIIQTSRAIGYCITPNITSDKIVKVLVPEQGLYAGQIVNCVSLAANVEGVDNNLEVYTATIPTNATLGSKFFALVLNGGFDTMADGRRPDGQPDYTYYSYKEGDVAPAVLIEKNIVFEIGTSVVSGANVLNVKNDIGKFIVPADHTYNGTVTQTKTNGNCVMIIGVRDFPVGGAFGANFLPTYICKGQ